jgi:hypothetical protein
LNYSHITTTAAAVGGGGGKQFDMHWLPHCTEKCQQSANAFDHKLLTEIERF